MKRFVQWIILGVIVPFTAFALNVGSTWPQEAVTTQLKNIDEKEVTISGVQGKKGTLVIFSCNHCPYVNAWQDRMVLLGNKYQEQGIGVILVNSNDPNKVPQDDFSAMQKLAKEKAYKFHYAVDGTSAVASAFGATRTPEAFLFDPQGKLVYHGTIDDNAEEALKVQKRYLEDALRALINGKQPAVSETKSIGCTIKFRADK